MKLAELNKVDCDLPLCVCMYSLTAGAKYYYRFGDDTFGWSDEFTFNAAPVPGPNVTTKVLAFGGTRD